MLEVAAYAEEDDARIAELEAWAGLWTQKNNAICEEWESHWDLRESYEVRKFYFIFALFDQLDIDFPGLRTPRDVIRDNIADLTKFDGVAPKARRMFAARFLCDFEREAEEAVPALIVATSDQELEVRVWAHAALAAITGDAEQHRQAIRTILERPDLSESERLSVESALEDGEKTTTQRLVSRLTSAAIMNDLVELLLRHGADPNAQDDDGQTSLDIARAKRRMKTVALLKAAM